MTSSYYELRKLSRKYSHGKELAHFFESRGFPRSGHTLHRKTALQQKTSVEFPNDALQSFLMVGYRETAGPCDWSGSSLSAHMIFRGGGHLLLLLLLLLWALWHKPSEH